MKTIENLVHNHGRHQMPGPGCPETAEYGRLRGACLRDYQICKRDNVWRLYQRGIWLDTFPTLQEAHTYATACAITDLLFEPGGLTCLKKLVSR